MNIKKLNKKNAALQSAIEYLTTYAWAILVIAIVITALFGLHLFNSTFLLRKHNLVHAKLFINTIIIQALN